MILTFNNKILSAGSKWLEHVALPKAIFQFSDLSYSPATDDTNSSHRWVQVSADPNIWDMYCDDPNPMFNLAPNMSSEWYSWSPANSSNKVTVLSVNFGGSWDNAFAGTRYGVTSVSNITGKPTSFEKAFRLTHAQLSPIDCSELTSLKDAFQSSYVTGITLENTSNVTSVNGTFYQSHISALPLFDTSNVTDWTYFATSNKDITSIPDYAISPNLYSAEYAFRWCNNVQSGMLNLYNKMKNTNVARHSTTFEQCGVDANGNYASEQARLERAQIPTTWGGDMQV